MLLAGVSWFGQHSAMWFTILLDATVKGVVLVALAAGVSVALRRASASARHLVWLLAIGGLLCLPALSAVLPAWRLAILPEGVAPIVEARVTPAPVPIHRHPPVAPPMPAPTAPSSIEPFPQAPAVAAVPPPSNPPPPAPVARPVEAPRRTIHWSAWVLLAWLSGVVLMALPLVVGTIRVWLMVRRARPMEDGTWRVLLADLSRQLGLRRAVRLLRSDRTAMPLTWGLCRTVALLPGNADEWPDDRRRIVLLHELAHAKRWDCPTQMLAQVVRALYWFNPLAWLAVRRFCVERERACDDLALTHGFKASDYAEHLLAFVRSLRSPSFSTLAAVGLVRRSRLEQRLREILDARRNRRSLTRAAFIAALLAASCVLPPLAAARLTARAKAEADKSEIPATRSADSDLVESLSQPDVDVRRRAAADLCIRLLKRNGVWRVDPHDWKIPTEDGIRLEVSAVKSSDQRSDLAIANMAAHCMGMLQGATWRTAPIDRADTIEQTVIEAVGRTKDPVVKAILLVGLGSSSSTLSRDTIVAATADPDLGVRRTASYLVQRGAANQWGPIGVIHIGSPEEDVDLSGRRIREIYKRDKTLGAGPATRPADAATPQGSWRASIQAAKTAEEFKTAAAKRFAEMPAGTLLPLAALKAEGALGKGWRLSGSSESPSEGLLTLIFVAQQEVLKIAGEQEVVAQLRVFSTADGARLWALHRSFSGAAPTDYLLALAKKHFLGETDLGDVCFNPARFVRGNVVVEYGSSMSEENARRVSKALDQPLLALAQSAEKTLPLPGSRASIGEALKPDYALVAVCEAVDEPVVKMIVDDGGITSAAQQSIQQRFYTRVYLAGLWADDVAFDLYYSCAYTAAHRERAVRKGERVIWVMRRRGDLPGYFGAKALADTPENRKAVLDAVKSDSPATRPAATQGEDAARTPEERGRARALNDIKAGTARILYYGIPWSADKPLVDDATGLPVVIVEGCDVTKEFAEEVDAYNRTVREWWANRAKGAPAAAATRPAEGMVGITHLLDMTPEQVRAAQEWQEKQGPTVEPAKFFEFLQTILDERQRALLTRVIESPTAPPATRPAAQSREFTITLTDVEPRIKRDRGDSEALFLKFLQEARESHEVLVVRLRPPVLHRDLVFVLDAARKAGFERIRLATDEDADASAPATPPAHEADWSEPANGLRWRAWPERDTVEAGGPVKVNIEFQNVSDGDLRIFKDVTTDRSIYPTVFTPDGKKDVLEIEHPHEWNVLAEETVLLRPKETYRTKWSWRAPQVIGPARLWFYYDAPVNTNPQVKDFWTGLLPGLTLEFTVLAAPATRPATEARRGPTVPVGMPLGDALQLLEESGANDIRPWTEERPIQEPKIARDLYMFMLADRTCLRLLAEGPRGDEGYGIDLVVKSLVLGEPRKGYEDEAVWQKQKKASVAELEVPVAPPRPKEPFVEFRIVPNNASTRREPMRTQEEFARFAEDLVRRGPDPEEAGERDYCWGEVAYDDVFRRVEGQNRTEKRPGMEFTADFKDQEYLLLEKRPGFTMLPSPGGQHAWGLKDVTAIKDEAGKLAVSVRLDENGTRLLADLTRRNVGNRLAVVLCERSRRFASLSVIRAPLEDGRVLITRSGAGGPGVWLIQDDLTVAECRRLVEALAKDAPASRPALTADEDETEPTAYGYPVLQRDVDEAQARLAEAKAALDAAKADGERVKRLVEAGAATQAELDAAWVKVAESEAAVAEAQAEVKRLTGGDAAKPFTVPLKDGRAVVIAPQVEKFGGLVSLEGFRDRATAAIRRELEFDPDARAEDVVFNVTRAWERDGNEGDGRRPPPLAWS